MIEALVSAADRLVKLLEYRDVAANKRFSALYDPLFNDLLLVHGDYISMFENTNNLLPKNVAYESHQYSEQMRKAVEYLRERRREFAPVRTKIHAIAKSIDEASLSKDEELFIKEVVDYFPHGTLWEMRTDGYSLLKELQYYSDKPKIKIPEEVLAKMYPADLQMLIMSVVRKHREQWSKVCSAYAPLKVSAAIRSGPAAKA